MRLRNVPGARENIAKHELAINEPEKNKGKWNEVNEEKRKMKSKTLNLFALIFSYCRYKSLIATPFVRI